MEQEYYNAYYDINEYYEASIVDEMNMHIELNETKTEYGTKGIS